MKQGQFIRFLAVVFLAALVSPGAGSAAMTAGAPRQDAAPSEQDEALAAMKRGEIMAYAKIRRRAEARLKGDLVGARLRRTGRGWIYEVRVRQKGGKVVFAILDARNGRDITKEAVKSRRGQ